METVNDVLIKTWCELVVQTSLKKRERLIYNMIGYPKWIDDLHDEMQAKYGDKNAVR